ncbi:MAG: NUDIX domain-containing protein [Thermotogota bacterium]
MKDYRLNNKKIEKYLKTKSIKLDLKKIIKNKKQKLAVICYAENEHGEFLLLERYKEPFSGKLVAPGGKTDYEEDIEESMRREFFEETGINLKSMSLEIITSEDGPNHYNWILIIYTSKIKKQPLIDSDEGILNWVRKEELNKNNITSIDTELLNHIFDDKKKYVDITYKTSEKFVINEIKDLY